jgi:hypothetical protein
MLAVGYVGLFVEVHLECRGVAIPMNGGMTAVTIFGLGAGLATFLLVYLCKPTSGLRLRFSRVWTTSGSIEAYVARSDER